MKRAIAFAVSLVAFGPVAGPVLAQDDGEARFLSRSAQPPLSVRAMPAAPPVHKLSIGPLSTPADEAATTGTTEGTLVESAQEALVRRANAGDADSNYRLGLKHLAGEGVTRDFVEAFARIRLAAEAGHVRAISLFYTMGARLTAEEHGQAYLRTQQLRPAARAAR
jgi:TPR repeat protein